MPSYHDIDAAVRNALKNKGLRTSHVAVLDEKGMVAGRFSIRVTANILDLCEKKFVRYDTTTKLLYARLRYWWMSGNDKWINRIISEFRQLGILVRVSAMPGYVFKSGYFQKQ